MAACPSAWKRSRQLLAHQLKPSACPAARGLPDHPESAMLDEVPAAYRRDGVAHVALRDCQALVIDGETREVV